MFLSHAAPLNGLLVNAMYLFIDKKIPLLIIIDFESPKLLTNCFIGTSQNGENIDFNSKIYTDSMYDVV
jgi:hypothetical protein